MNPDPHPEYLIPIPIPGPRPPLVLSKRPTKRPNAWSRSRIPDPGVDFPSPERDGVYIAAIYTPTSPLVSRRTPPPSHLAVPSLLVLRFPRRCYPLPPPCRQGLLRHPLAAIVRPEPRGDSSAGTSGRIDKFGLSDLSGEGWMERDGGSSPQVRRGTASISRRSYRQPLRCLLGWRARRAK